MRWWVDLGGSCIWAENGGVEIEMDRNARAGFGHDVSEPELELDALQYLEQMHQELLRAAE